jgi:hypothetical protein
MKPITDFYITCLHDIYNELVDIEKQIPLPGGKPKSITHVFDEEKSVKWNREQVEAYNKKTAELRREAVECRAQSYKNLDEAVIDYLMQYEAESTTPRAVIKEVVIRAQKDHDDDWWNYLNDYVEFAEAVIKSFKES